MYTYLPEKKTLIDKWVSTSLIKVDFYRIELSNLSEVVESKCEGNQSQYNSNTCMAITYDSVPYIPYQLSYEAMSVVFRTFRQGVNSYLLNNPNTS